MTGRRLSRTFRKLSSVLSRGSYPFKRAHSSLYGLRRTAALRLPLLRTSLFSLKTCLSSRCVLVSRISFTNVYQTTMPTMIFSERLVSLTLPHKLLHQDGHYVISSPTFAQYTQRQRKPCEYYAGVAIHLRVVSVFCAVVPRALRSRVSWGGKRMCKVN